MATKRREVAAATAAAVADLRKAHEIGSEILEVYPADKPLGSKTIKELADRLGLKNADQVRGFRRFANQYSEKDLNRLCGLCEQYDRVVGFTLVVKIMQIADKAQRRKYERQMIAEGWSYDELQVIRFKTGRRPKVGRHPKLPSTTEQMLVMLEGMCMRWGRLYDALSQSTDSESHIGLKDLTTGVRKQLKAATEAIGTLETAIAHRLKESRAVKEHNGASMRGNAAPGARRGRR